MPGSLVIFCECMHRALRGLLTWLMKTNIIEEHIDIFLDISGKNDRILSLARVGVGEVTAGAVIHFSVSG